MKLECRSCLWLVGPEKKNEDGEHYCYVDQPQVVAKPDGSLTSARPSVKLNWFCSKWKERN